MDEDEVLTCAFSPTQSADLKQILDDLCNGGLKATEVDIDSLESGFTALDEATTDLLLVSAQDLPRGDIPDGVEVVGALPLKDWNWVIVSDDRPLHLPKSEVVLVDNQLLRRQMRRFRPDLRVRSASAHIGLEGLERPADLQDGDHLSFANWAEELRRAGTIVGFVIPRHIHHQMRFKTRRHTLDSEPKEDEFVRFLPPPHSGITLILGRRGFPRSRIENISSTETMTAWRITENLLSKLDDSEQAVTGISVRHRQPATLLNEAERRRDLVTHNTLVDPEGNLVSDLVKIDIQIEMVTRLGDSTISMQRVADLNDADVVANFLGDEWVRLIRMTASEGDFIEI